MNKRGEMMDKLFDLVEMIGTDATLSNIASWMSVDDLESCLKYIDRMYETNLFYNGAYYTEIQDWTGNILTSFSFEEHGDDCEWYAIIKREEMASEQARKEWEENEEKCIKDGYNTVEELEDAILGDMYVVSYDRDWNNIPVNFG